MPTVAGVAITTPTRPVYPAFRFTKLDLARLYACVAERMLPYIAQRPLTLLRCEGGVTKADALRTECKFLKHGAGWHRWAGPHVSRVQIPELKKIGEYLVVDSPEGLLELVQGDILEIHCWNSNTRDLERPDRFVFDLDPAPNVASPNVVRAALTLRDHLRQLKLQSWAKLTGGKGVHVVIPFEQELEWRETYRVARLIAESCAREHPTEFTLDFAKNARSSKILIDYKRNHRAAVAVAAYSVRAHPRGTVSVPVRWSELAKMAPDQFSVQTLPQRLRRVREDPWEDYWSCRQRLPDFGPRK